MRDSIKDELYFNNYLIKNSELLAKLKKGLQNSQGDKDKEGRYFSAMVFLEFRLLKAFYSAGNPVNDIKSLFEELLNEIPVFWNANSSICDIYDVLSLAILFKCDKSKLIRIFNLLDSTNRNDALTDFYKKYITEKIIEARGKTSYGYPYDNLLDIVNDQTKDSFLQIKNYLTKDWYKGHKQAFWYNSHKKEDSYFGYWSFEAGAVAKILGIDDSGLKNVPYYPYDLVHYADN